MTSTSCTCVGDVRLGDRSFDLVLKDPECRHPSHRIVPLPIPKPATESHDD